MEMKEVSSTKYYPTGLLYNNPLPPPLIPHKPYIPLEIPPNSRSNVWPYVHLRTVQPRAMPQVV